MLVLDAALESPQQPPFEQGGDFSWTVGMTSCASSEPPLITVT